MAPIDFNPGQIVEVYTQEAFFVKRNVWLPNYPELYNNIKEELAEEAEKLVEKYDDKTCYWSNNWASVKDWVLAFLVQQIKIEKLELLEEDHIIYGPYKNVAYNGKAGRMILFREVNNMAIQQIDIPIGMIGMVVKKVLMSADKNFYNDETGITDPTFREPGYIVFVTNLFDIIKSGYYLIPAKNLKLLDENKEITFYNLTVKPLIREPDPNEM